MSGALAERLGARWARLVERTGARPDAAAVVCAKLLADYGASDRRYHGLAHLDFLFGEIDRLKARLENPDAVEYAAWFHDWIYDTQRADNEARSAEAARAAMTEMNLPKALGETVADLVVRTASHADGGSPDGAFFLDMDFAILGVPADVYDRYARDVRAEYGWVPEELFVAGRSDFLRRTLTRPRLFLTDEYETRLGAQARANIGRELAAMNGMPG